MAEAERLRLEAEEHERVTGEKMMARALIAMQKCEIKRGFNASVDMYDKKAWAYSIGMGGGEMPSSGGAGAPAKPTGLTLSIEPLGGNVLLAIRSL